MRRVLAVVAFDAVAIALVALLASGIAAAAGFRDAPDVLARGGLVFLLLGVASFMLSGDDRMGLDRDNRRGRETSDR